MVGLGAGNAAERGADRDAHLGLGDGHGPLSDPKARVLDRELCRGDRELREAVHAAGAFGDEEGGGIEVGDLSGDPGAEGGCVEARQGSHAPAARAHPFPEFALARADGRDHADAGQGHAVADGGGDHAACSPRSAIARKQPSVFFTMGSMNSRAMMRSASQRPSGTRSVRS